MRPGAEDTPHMLLLLPIGASHLYMVLLVISHTTNHSDLLVRDVCVCVSWSQEGHTMLAFRQRAVSGRSVRSDAQSGDAWESLACWCARCVLMVVRRWDAASIADIGRRKGQMKARSCHVW